MPEHLLIWGYSRLIVELQERLQDKLKSAKLQISGLEVLGLAYESLGQYEKAITFYEQAIALVSTDQGKNLFLFHLGNCYFYVGQTTQAIAYYEKSLNIAHKLKENLARIAGLPVWQWVTMGKLGKNADLANQLLQISRDECANLIGLGNCYHGQGQLKQGIEYYEQALAISRETGDRLGEVVALNDLGSVYVKLGQVARAIEYCEQALSISREIGDRRNEGVSLGSLGGVYSGLGQVARAIEYCEQALTISREIGDRRNEGISLGSLGGVYVKLGQVARAIECCEQALTISREIGNRDNEGVILGRLGSTYSELGQATRAIEYCEQALTISREIGNRVIESSCFIVLAIVMLDEARYSEAVQYGLESVKIAQEVGGYASYGNTMLALAYLYMADLSLARTAAENARQHDEPSSNHNALALLGVIALRQEDVFAAQDAFTAAVTHADKILSYTPQYFEALDAKGLTVCGLALCANQSRSPELIPDSVENYISQAIEAYEAARAITKAAGIVGRVLRLFDALAVVDKTGILAKVRPIAAGESDSAE